MPGDVSLAYPGVPICACQHFKDLHNGIGDRCMADHCTCLQFRETALDDTEFGQAMNEFLERMKRRRMKMPSKHKRKPRSGSARRTRFRL